MDIQDPNYIKYQELVDGKNINPTTLLATDYLNHFNEIHMLLGMMFEMPDCLEDILEWKPLSYQQHFEYSMFQDKDLAIEAYNFSPEKYKLPFDERITQMSELLQNTISSIEEAILQNNMDKVKFIVDDYTPRMALLIEECSAIINSKEGPSTQDAIDDLFDDEIETDSIDQSSIDDLFD